MITSKIALAILIASNTFGIRPEIIRAIIKVESSGRPTATGSLGEVGLMQLRPEFHECATYDVLENVLCGTKYLKALKKRHGARHPESWFVFFNTGPNKHLDNPKLTRYYKKVTKELRNENN